MISVGVFGFLLVIELRKARRFIVLVFIGSRYFRGLILCKRVFGRGLGGMVGYCVRYWIR